MITNPDSTRMELLKRHLPLILTSLTVGAVFYGMEFALRYLLFRETSSHVTLEGGLIAGGFVATVATISEQKKSIDMQRQVISDETTWARSKLTIDIMGEWNTTARLYLEDLWRAYPELRDIPRGTFARLGTDEAKRIYSGEGYRATAAGPGIPYSEIRQQLLSLLNYFEFLAVACEKSAVDEEVLRESFGKLVTSTVDYFESFDSVFSTKSYRGWPPLDRLAEKWSKKK